MHIRHSQFLAMNFLMFTQYFVGPMLESFTFGDGFFQFQDNKVSLNQALGHNHENTIFQPLCINQLSNKVVLEMTTEIVNQQYSKQFWKTPDNVNTNIHIIVLINLISVSKKMLRFLRSHKFWIINVTVFVEVIFI